MRAAIDILPIDAQRHQRMVQASIEDHGHSAPFATHVFERAGEIVGATSLFAPTQTFWAHSTKMHARESIEVIRRCRAAVSGKHYLVLCAPESPFHPLMEKLGHQRLGNVDVYHI